MPAGGRRPGAGRKKGTPNKLTADLKEMILTAAEQAGGKEGTVGYLVAQAEANPTAFLSLLGKVLPMTVQGTGEEGEFVVKMIERRIVSSND